MDMAEDPHLTGVSQALKPEMIAGIVLDNPMEDLFLLIVDRDGDNSGHRLAAAQLRRSHPDRLAPCLAHQEGGSLDDRSPSRQD
jgi:hypothetical protein